MLMRLACLLLLALLASGQPLAQSAFDAIDPDDPNPFSDAALVSEASGVAPGETVEVALVITQDPGWHSYWLNGGDAGAPTTIEWRLPEGVTAGPLRFPVPRDHRAGGPGVVRLRGRGRAADDVHDPRGRRQRPARGWRAPPSGSSAPRSASPPRPRSRSRSTSARAWLDASGASRIARAKGLLPADVRGWSVEAIPSEGGFQLRAVPSPGWRGSLDGAYFFPEASGVIDYAAPQPVSRDGEAWVLDLDGSGIAETPAALDGILVAPAGETFDGTHRALAVSAPVPQMMASGASGARRRWPRCGSRCCSRWAAASCST